MAHQRSAPQGRGPNGERRQLAGAAEPLLRSTCIRIALALRLEANAIADHGLSIALADLLDTIRHLEAMDGRIFAEDGEED